MRRFAIITLCVAAAALCVSAGSGYYVPRAYFTIDENGQQSPLYFVDPTLVHRVRRSPQFSSSSSTTSTSTSSGAGAGGPIFFNPLPGFGGGFGGGFGPGLGGNNFYPQHGSSTFSGVSTSTSTGGSGGGLDNRFGGDDTKVTGQSHTITTQNGQFQQTSSHLGDDGKVHFTVQSGKF